MTAVYKTDILPIRIDNELRAAVSAAALRDSVSVSEYIRTAIANEIANADVKDRNVDVISDKFAAVDDRLSTIEIVLKQIADDVKTIKENSLEADKTLGVLMRRQDKQRVADADMHDLVQKIGILVANYSKPLGLPSIFDPLIKELTQA